MICNIVFVSEIIAVGDKNKRGRPSNAAGALSGPKTYSLANNPTSIFRKNVLIESDVGIIVGYIRSKWTVRFPLLLDENGDMTLKEFSLNNILEGIKDYKEILGGSE